MPGKTIILEGLPAELRAIGQQLAGGIVKALQSAAVEIRSEAVVQVGEVKPYAPINTAAMRRGFITRFLPDGAVVENTVPYAAHMEYGTRPHWAPLAPLERWAEAKLRGKFKSPKSRAAPAKTLARAVQRKIAKRGTAARGFWRATMAKAPAIVDRHLEAAMKAVT